MTEMSENKDFVPTPEKDWRWISNDAPKCPACKSQDFTLAYMVVPRIEDEIRICLDCGCLFALISPSVRGRLKAERGAKNG